MRKSLLELTALISAALMMLVGCQKEISVTSVTLNEKEKTLQVDETLQLNCKIAPADATDQAVAWTTTDAKIAKVSDKGLVTAVAPGKATIKVTTLSGNRSASCVITVVQSAEGITFDVTEKSLKPGEKFTLQVTFTPENVTDKTLTWESSKADVAKVSDKGEVEALKAGETTITAKTADGKTATCTVTVSQPVTGVTLDKTTLTLKPDQEVTLKATLSPEGATNQKVSWKSSKTDIATVSDKGVVKGLKAGKATITVTTEDGSKTATCEVTVSEPVTGVTLNLASKELKPQETVQLTATVAPAGASNKNVSWKSSAEGVATVSATGLVTAVAAGQATITVTTEDGAKTATCAITVKVQMVPKDYVEYGQNQGKGILINGVIWAPVNCGTNMSYPMGKSFQWGRKSGQGDDREMFIKKEAQPANGKELPDRFYTAWGPELAPEGTWGGKDGMTKTEKDPCPAGWRIPTRAEFQSLKGTAETPFEVATWNNSGIWFGENHATATKEDPKGCLFLPAAGYRGSGGTFMFRTQMGRYWASDITEAGRAAAFTFTNTTASDTADQELIYGYHVRCVQAE